MGAARIIDAFPASQRQTATVFGISKSVVGNIRRGEHWSKDHFVEQGRA